MLYVNLKLRFMIKFGIPIPIEEVDIEDVEDFESAVWIFFWKRFLNFFWKRILKFWKFICYYLSTRLYIRSTFHYIKHRKNVYFKSLFLNLIFRKQYTNLLQFSFFRLLKIAPQPYYYIAHFCFAPISNGEIEIKIYSNTKCKNRGDVHSKYFLNIVLVDI